MAKDLYTPSESEKLRDLTVYISNRISIKNIIDALGIEVRRGYVRCGNERTPSCKIYFKEDKFKCFSCGAYGGVISFVAHQLGCDRRTAIYTIDNLFGLGIAQNKVNKEELEKAREQAKIWERELRQKELNDKILNRWRVRIAGEIRQLEDTYAVLTDCDAPISDETLLVAKSLEEHYIVECGLSETPERPLLTIYGNEAVIREIAMTRYGLCDERPKNRERAIALAWLLEKGEINI